MPEVTYDWKRYWYPTGNEPTLADGFLLVPSESYLALYKSETSLVRFEEIADTPCLILLGEPGIGKSYAIRDACDAVKTSLEGSVAHPHFIDLAEYSETDLTQELDRVLNSWDSGGYHLHLFLDSLDEARSRMSTITHSLARRLRRHSGSMDRLHLRIACREANWPPDFEDKLCELWGEESVRAYVLAPLGRQDVEEAARVNGIDPNAFMHEILKKEVGPLAANPITLKFLVPLYQQNEQLSRTRYDLYLDGCKELCRDRNEGKLPIEQRFVVAARIAACTIFSNRYRIYTETTWDNNTEADYVTIQQLTQGPERIDDTSFHVGEDAIRETLDTALFRGSTYRTWAHQTYAEFLVAWYVTKNMTPTQVKSLIFHPDGKLVPQLHQTAAWVACMEDEVFWEILEVEPQVLLRSDIMTIDAESKAKLVESLLRLYEDGPIPDPRVFAWHSKLDHPDLAKQVRPYIEDRSKHIETRIAAVDIAGACKLQSLQNLLVDVALSPEEPIEVRTDAAHVVAQIGDDEAKARLKPLALLPLAEILDRGTDQLKQYGLQATWPKYVSAVELFATLTAPQETDYIFLGNYLPDLIPPCLDDPVLPIALGWVGRQPRRHDLPYSFLWLMDSIMLRAWESLDAPDVADAFAQAALARLLKYDPIASDDRMYGLRSASPFDEMLREGDKKRHQILECMIPLLSAYVPNAYYESSPMAQEDIQAILRFDGFLHKVCDALFATHQDIPWLIQRFTVTDSKAPRAVLAGFIGRVLRKNPDQFEGVYYACKSDPTLEEALNRPFDPWPLDSPRGERWRQSRAEQEKWEKEMEERRNLPPLDPSPKTRVLSLLETCESGRPEEWWHISYWMMHKPDGTYDFDKKLEIDLESCPVWGEIDSATQMRVTQTAKNYIQVYDPSSHKWLEESRSTRYYPVIAGYRAFRLLLKNAPNLLATVPINVWQRWAPVIFFYSSEARRMQSRDEASENLDQTLIQQAYQNAPEPIIETLMQLIDMENKQGHLIIAQWAEAFWHERLAQALFEKARDENLEPNCMGVLLNQLLVHEFKRAGAFAKSLVRLPVPKDDKARQRAVVAARALMTNTADVGWGVVWPAFQEDEEFGQEVVRGLVSGWPHRGESVVTGLIEVQLADFYIWLVHQFPPAQDPKSEGEITIDHELARFRDSMLMLLRKKGTESACQELQRIINEFPELNLRWHLVQARDLFRRGTWIWPKPEHILELTKSQDKGLVESGEQLLDVIIEALGRLQKQLFNDKLPAVLDLWSEFDWSRVRRIAESLPTEPKADFRGQKDAIANSWCHVNWKKLGPTKLYVPKDEGSLSDYIARHLKELESRGIVVNREVNVRHERGRTDIFVDAFRKRDDGTADDIITAVIEVKGCWNTQVERAMEAQLVDEYLRSSSSYGLYLVGFFNCDQWHPSDRRKSKCQKYTLQKLKTQLEAQASDLSGDGLQVRAFVIDARLP